MVAEEMASRGPGVDRRLVGPWFFGCKGEQGPGHRPQVGRPLVFRIQQGVLRTSPEFTQGGVWQRARDRMLVSLPAGTNLRSVPARRSPNGICKVGVCESGLDRGRLGPVADAGAGLPWIGVEQFRARRKPMYSSSWDCSA